MTVHGPRVKRTVTIPAHEVEVLDNDAYWQVDPEQVLDGHSLRRRRRTDDIERMEPRKPWAEGLQP
jgi:hypothetical protein